MKLIKSVTPFLISVFAIVSVWYITTNILEVEKMFIPKLSDTLNQLSVLTFTEEYWLDISSSLYRILVGFVLSFVISYSLVIVSLFNKYVKDIIFYIVEFFRYLPIPVFIPLTILWFGVDDFGKIMIVFLGTFSQMVPMYYDSTQLLENKYDSFRFGVKWSRWKYIKYITIPGSAPFIMDNSRLCLGWAWTYLIIAELLGAENGLGYAIIRAQRYLSTDKIFAYIITIGIIGILSDRMINFIKLKIFKWQK